MIYHAVFLLLLMTGFFCLLTEKNLMKLAIGTSLMESATFFWTITLAGRAGIVPIYDLLHLGGRTLMVDPVLQALTLTAVVIGASTTALLLTLMVELVRQTRTLDVNSIEGLRE